MLRVRASPTTPMISTGVLPLDTISVLPIGFSFPKTLRACLTDQDHVLMIGHIVLIEIAPSQDGNAEGLEIARSDIVTCGCGTLIPTRSTYFRGGNQCSA